jgi:phospholipid transport system substrate-binding protein
MRRRDMLILMSAAVLARPASLRAQASGPKAPILELNAALLQIMKAGSNHVPFDQRAQILLPAVQRAFNLRQLLQSSVGFKWRNIPPATQTELLSVFTDYTVDNYVANFDSYNGQRIEVMPQTRTVGPDTIVSSQIVSTSGDTNTIDYVMRTYPQGWQAVDVLFNHISRVATQRSDFSSLVGSDGSRLLASLRRKVAELQNGSAG